MLTTWLKVFLGFRQKKQLPSGRTLFFGFILSWIKSIFEFFYLISEKGAIGFSVHEKIYFVWFHVWNNLFQDSYEEYEIPSLKWILSEMVVESIKKDPRLASIEPYFPRENGGCIYPFFFDMKVNGDYVLEVVDKMYDEMDIRTFMMSSFEYCKIHEEEIRKHIEASNGI